LSKLLNSHELVVRIRKYQILCLTAESWLIRRSAYIRAGYAMAEIFQLALTHFDLYIAFAFSVVVSLVRMTVTGGQRGDHQ
jgi:hypothetical protein